MQAFEFQNLQKQISKSQLQNFYLVYGEDPFLLSGLLKNFKSHIKDMEDFNFEEFSAPEARPLQVKDSFETLPVFSDKKLIFYYNIEKLKEADLKYLKHLLQSPNPTATLVFIAESLDKRTKSF